VILGLLIQSHAGTLIWTMVVIDHLPMVVGTMYCNVALN
jgi:hypothetical protein